MADRELSDSSNELSGTQPEPTPPSPGSSAITPRSLTAGALAEALIADQRKRWQHGEWVAVEDYLVRFPQLGAEPEAVVDLIYGEFLLREARGEAPTAQEYAGRFPAHAAILQEQIKLHEALATSSSLPPLDDEAGQTDPGPVNSGLRYRILRPHAKGGLGEVFVAEDLELGREIALKEIQVAHADHPDRRRRFLLEGRITGKLEHPGIVPVYGLGAYVDGRPYYAMRFIKGDDLKQAIDRFHQSKQAFHSMAFQHLLRRFLDVCNAIAYAHSRGVLHRDLKPSNVMVGQYGETLVVDWGFAKVIGRDGDSSTPSADARERPVETELASSSSGTLEGATMGTPAYMSPEQAGGNMEGLGPRSDVYGLGATLYTLLTNSAPVQGDSVGAVLAKVRFGEITLPRQMRADVPKALEAICCKAMALRQADRYDSALALAEDIEHWLADEPVTAYRELASARLARWTRKRRTLVATAAASLLVGVVGLTLGLLIVSELNRRLENTNSDLADSNRQLKRPIAS